MDRSLANGVKVKAWTFDELYGRDAKFLDALDRRKQAFVGEIPGNFQCWVKRPGVIRRPQPGSRKGRKKKYPRVKKSSRSSKVKDLAIYSPVFQDQNWQKYRIKETDRGPEVWEIKWALVWRKIEDKLPSRQHTLIVARNVRTGEVKYFLSNQVVGRAGVTLRWLLRVSFGRWVVEACFRTAKNELGMDHFEVRGWRCVHRHYYVTQLSFLFSSRLRQTWDDLEQEDALNKLTIEQVREAVNVYLSNRDLLPSPRKKRYQKAIDDLRYHQRRNAQATKSHTKTRRKLFEKLGFDVDRIKSCQPKEKTS